MAMIDKNTAIGAEFAGKPKKMAWERLWAFSGGPFSNSGWPRKNLHTDLEFAKNLGLPTVGASATQYLGHLAEMMVDIFGDQWYYGGKMEGAKFIKLVANDDVITSRARVTAKEQDGDAVKFTLDIDVVNQNGDKVLIGTAYGTVK